MSENLRHIGKTGEEAALVFLERKGYQHLESNFFTRWGEIDLIMKYGGGVVFVEVKKRRSGQYGSPLESIHARKRDHMIKAALHYMNQKRWFDTRIQFDFVCVTPGGLEHYPDAMDASEGKYF